MPLAMHALFRLQAQVGETMINANRNLAAYESMGVPVWPDAQSDFPGPLAGMLVGLERCETPYLVTVPCDTPNFPLDLVERLARSLAAEGAEIAMAATREDGQVMAQPVFCLLKAELLAQRPQVLLVRLPARHRAAIDRLAHLDHAHSMDRALGFVKRETAIVPVETAICNDAPRVCPDIFDQILVLHLQHTSGRKDGNCSISATRSRRAPVPLP